MNLRKMVCSAFAFITLPFLGEASGSGYYAFSSGEVVAAYKSGFLPVLSGDKKGVYIDTDKGLKRLRYSNECRLLPNLEVTDQFVNISEIKFGFDNLHQSQLETGAMSESMRAEVGAEREIILKGGGMASQPNVNLSEETQAEIEEIKQQQAHGDQLIREALEEDAYSRGALSDLINVKFKLLSQSDLKNVYCAMVVHYLRKGGSNFDKLVKAKVVRLKKVGDLSEGKSSTMKFAYPLAEGFVNEHGIELVLFHGEGNPLATNESRNLRELSIEELKKYQSAQ